MSGYFITFEGGEGTGKSTQVAKLAERLERLDLTVVTTREPGGTTEAETLRSLLVSGETTRWTADEELLLNFTARSTHLRQKILPSLKSNAVVICDRFIDSTFVYQCCAGGADSKLFESVCKHVVGSNLPDLTFVLDLEPSVGVLRSRNRMASMKIMSEELAQEAVDTNSDELFNAAMNISTASNEDRFERKGIEFHKQVRESFRSLAEVFSQRCLLVDATPGADIVSDRIWALLSQRIANWKANVSPNG